MDFLLTLVSSTGFGALLGLAGGIIQKHQETKLIALQNEFKLNMLSAKTDAQIQLADKAIEATEVQGKVDVAKIDATAFKESMKLVNNYGWVRPLLTLYLVMLATYITYLVWELADGLNSLPPEKVLQLIQLVTLQVLVLTSIAVGWWFANRTSKGFTDLMNKIMS
jgi:hypothetical protein|tara:strand:+ start:2884 stop:3381 length:498 start_codon:yes stop_codon:yes gene_type:complete